MKYKVVLTFNGSGETGLSVATFYTKAQAISCAEQWREIGSSYFAYLWDGSAWTTYAPIP